MYHSCYEILPTIFSVLYEVPRVEVVTMQYDSSIPSHCHLFVLMNIFCLEKIYLPSIPKQRLYSATMLKARSYDSHHARALLNIWNHGPAVPRVPGCQLLLSVVTTRSGCGMSAKNLPSVVCTPAMLPGLPFGLSG